MSGMKMTSARSLKTVIERGALTLCVSSNALPFASKSGPIHGFQIELGEKIAEPTSSPARIRRPRAVCSFRAPTIAAAIEAMLADGSIARIHARYGIELKPSQ